MLTEGFSSDMEIVSRSWVVQSGSAIYSKNSDIPFGIASLTKILTAYTAIKYLGSSCSNKIVIVSANAATTKGSAAGLKAGDKLAFKDLLYAMLLPSGNDAAVAIAEYIGALLAKDDCLNTSSVSRFIQEMNINADHLGLKSFGIFDVHGLGRNIGSAVDVLTLGKRAIELDLLKAVLSTAEYSTVIENVHGEKKQLLWTNTNPILSDEGVIGGKTGRSSFAKSCLFVWSRVNHVDCFCVVMGSPDRKLSGIDAKRLINMIRQGRCISDVFPLLQKRPSAVEQDHDSPVLWIGQDLERVLFGSWFNLNSVNNLNINGISANPRYVSKGDLYFDHQIDQLSMSDRLELAYKNGAVAAVVDISPIDFPVNLPIYKVKNCLDALLQLSVVARYRTSANVIAVTGSVGKTGTKDMISSLLSELGPVHKSLKSMNDTWGIPISLSCIPRRIGFSVIEAGVMGRARMDLYSRMIAANVVVITAIEDVHLQYHNTKMQIADTKALLFAKAEMGSTVVLPRDCECFEFLYEKAKRLSNIGKIITFGENSESSVRLVCYECTRDGSEITIEIDGQLHSYFLSLIGVHHIMNSLAAIAAVYAVNQDVSKVLPALKHQKPGFRRGELITIDVNGGRALVVDDSWSANPASIRAALCAASHLKRPNGRLLICFGDMLELGRESDKHHRNLIPVIRDCGVDAVFTVGEMMNEMSANIGFGVTVGQFSIVQALAEAIKEFVRTDDVILVKGSNAMDMWRVVAELKR